jgi:hypothetical protein
MLAFLQETFQYFGGSFRTWHHKPHFNDTIQRAVEHVIEETFSNIRVLPGYAKRLQEPVANAFVYIDELVESIPAPFLCARQTFNHDPRVNGFFTNPEHVREVFSSSEEVRTLFDSHPDITECTALLCMHKQERRQLGIALEGEVLRRDVMQTAVSFDDHQLISPGASEVDARKALKCCVFNSLLDSVRHKANQAKRQVLELEMRLQQVRKQVRQAQTPAEQFEWQRQLAEVENDLLAVEPRLATLEDYLVFLAQVLDEPQAHIRSRQYPLHLSRLGIKRDSHDAQQLLLAEIQIATKEPRIAALVRFPRSELLPQQSFLKKADLFLSIL